MIHLFPVGFTAEADVMASLVPVHICDIRKLRVVSKKRNIILAGSIAGVVSHEELGPAGILRARAVGAGNSDLRAVRNGGVGRHHVVVLKRVAKRGVEDQSRRELVDSGSRTVPKSPGTIALFPGSRVERGALQPVIPKCRI